MMFLLVATLVPTLSLASLSFLSSFVPNSPNLHQSSYLVSSSSISNLRSENNFNTVISESIEPTIEQLNTSINKTYSNQSFHDSIQTTNRSNETDDRTLENTIAIVVPILFGLIFIIGLFGNALVVIVVTMNVFCVPFTASDYYFTIWQFGMVWCKIVQYLILVLACASNYTLVLMSLDRYLAVVHPVSSLSIRTAKNAYIAICLIWLFITVACLPALQLHSIVQYFDSSNNATVLSCTFNSTINISHTQFQLGFCVSSYVIPLLIAFALYFLMLKKLWFGLQSTNSSRLNNIRCRKRVTRMVIVVVLTFAFCWAPIQIILVLKSLNIYHTDSPASVVAQVASQILAYTNSCINPILYAFLSENFRKAFHKIIACNLVGIYGVTQASIVMQTGQTSVGPQSSYLASNRTNSAYKRNVLNKQLTTDLDNNNNKKDQLPDIIESVNKNLKSVNFSVVADGGLFPKNNSSDQIDKVYSDKDDDKIGEKTSLIDKQIKPKFNQSKGRFKTKQQYLDNENELDEFNDKMELHSTNNQQKDFIPMYEFGVPSNETDNELTSKESINDPINKNNNLTTETTIQYNTKSNGVFL